MAIFTPSRLVADYPPHWLMQAIRLLDVASRVDPARRHQITESLNGICSSTPFGPWPSMKFQSASLATDCNTLARSPEEPGDVKILVVDRPVALACTIPSHTPSSYAAEVGRSASGHAGIPAELNTEGVQIFNLDLS
ncbi:hypothetical protein ACFRQM_44670 [Streptomyces sp. NPDC056831]|uniref:hypothetical protein n=1 Tax=Streptomyces sp. NPDC056831 TaxID=3345954 RepID=UPI00369F5419